MQASPVSGWRVRYLLRALQPAQYRDSGFDRTAGRRGRFRFLWSLDSEHMA